jgi:hypothetical protein
MPASSCPRYHSLKLYASKHILKWIDFNAGIGAVEMLGKANFIALIGGGKLPKFPQNKVSWSVMKVITQSS